MNNAKIWFVFKSAHSDLLSCKKRNDVEEWMSKEEQTNDSCGLYEREKNQNDKIYERYNLRLYKSCKHVLTVLLFFAHSFHRLTIRVCTLCMLLCFLFKLSPCYVSTSDLPTAKFFADLIILIKRVWLLEINIINSTNDLDKL